MSLHIAILGILSEGNHHPYDIKKMLINRNMGNIPHLNDGSLYYNFEVLRKKQYIEKLEVVRDESRPNKTTYRITDLGREELEQEIYASFKNFTTIRGLYASTCFIKHADKTKVAFLIEEIIEKQQEKLRDSEELWNNAQNTVMETVHLIYNHANKQMRLEIEWLSELLDYVRK